MRGCALVLLFGMFIASIRSVYNIVVGEGDLGENIVGVGILICFIIFGVYCFSLDNAVKVQSGDGTSDSNDAACGDATSDSDAHTAYSGVDSDVDADDEEFDWEYFENCQQQARRMLKLLRRMNQDRDLVEYLNSLPDVDSVTGEPLNLWVDQALGIFYLMDLLKAYTEAGFESERPDKSMLCIGLITVAIFNTKELPKYDEYDYEHFCKNLHPHACRLCTTIKGWAVFEKKGEFNMTKLLSQSSDSSYYTQFCKQLFYMLQFASEGVPCDELTDEYYSYLGVIGKLPTYDQMNEQLRRTSSTLEDAQTDNARIAHPQNQVIENPMQQLDELIGLQAVKDDVKRLTNFIAIQKQRRDAGLKCTPISYHCVFTGNPGTGKTTVARILAAIYAEVGILNKGHLVETDRSGLVAEYVGQTAVKTNKIIDSALDGVLFIDEAYSLVQGGGNDYGLEAIATLLKRMEDDRERLVVILAGYSDEMRDFINANPGLESRFNRYIHFEDYSADDLMAIYRLQAERHEYLLSPDAETALKMTLDMDVANKDENFGNGRHVRNLFEKTLENQASRLAKLNPADLNRETLQLIQAEDIPV